MDIAFLGTGILGAPLAEKLLEHGHQLWAYNRTFHKAAGLKTLGAKICRHAREAMENADVIILVLADAAAIESVLFSDKRILKNKTVIQMGTISSSQSRGLLKRVNALGGEYFECPVLGNKNDAKAGRLILMAGARQEQFKKFLPLLKCFGAKPRLIGEVGKAATLKLALNHLIASHAACFSLSLGMVVKNGIDVDQFMGILNESSLGVPMYAKKLPNWLKRKYDHPNFSLKHLLKDTKLILEETREQKLNDAVLKAIKRLLDASVREGWAESDYSSIYETINKK